MRKSIFITILGLLIFNFSCGQNKENYSELIKEAWKLYEAKDFKQSAQKYSEAFSISGVTGKTGDKYNAACSWALAKEIDSSFVQLFEIVNNRNYSNYQHISTDNDFTPLHSDQRWPKLLNLVLKNKNKLEANLDKELVVVLDSILEEDQGLRRQIKDFQEKFGRYSDEMRSHFRAIAKKDSLNLIIIQKILDERGWLGKDVIGSDGNMTLFLVIQHAEIEVQKKYLPMMREAVKKGNAEPSALALLEDRVALREGGKQIYGSQIEQDPKTGEYFISPLFDPDNVDKRRAEVGLEPLQDYVSRWDINWNVEEYKKKLLELNEN